MIWSHYDADQLSMLPETVSFLNRNFGVEGADSVWSEEYFKWKLGNSNPAGSGHLSIALCEGEVVGTMSITRKRLLIDGKFVVAGEIGDSYSSPAIRRRGKPFDLISYDSNPNSYLNKSVFGRLAAETQLRAEANGIEIIYGTPNANAYPGWTKKLGYFEIDQQDFTYYVRPGAEGIVRQYPKLSGMKSILVPLDKMVTSVLKNCFRINNNRCLFEPVRPSYEKIDELWESTKPLSGFNFVRDASYWKHRYVDRPSVEYTFFSIIRDDQLCGILVARSYISFDLKKIVSVTEWMINSEVSLNWLLAELTYYFREHNADLISVYADKNVIKPGRLIKNLFFPRVSVPVIYSNSKTSRELQSNKGDFNLYLGNTDAV
jgi:hypothetical protein